MVGVSQKERTICEEELDHPGVAVLGCEVEARVALLALHVDVCARLNAPLDYGLPAVEGGLVEGGVAAKGRPIALPPLEHVRAALLDERPEDLPSDGLQKPPRRHLSPHSSLPVSHLSPKTHCDISDDAVT